MLTTPAAQLPQSAMTPYPPGLAPQGVHKQLEDMRQQLIAFHYMFQSGIDYKAETVSQALVQGVPTPSALRPRKGFLTVEKQQPRPVSHSSGVYRDQQAKGCVWDVAWRRSPRCYYSLAPSHHRRTTPETRRALWRDDGRHQSSEEDQDDWGHIELYRYCSPGQGEHCAHRELLSGLQFFIKRFCITMGPSSPWLPETELKILSDCDQAGLDLMGYVPAMQTFQGHMLDGLLPTARRAHTAIVKDLHTPGDLDRPPHGTPSSPRKDTSSPRKDSTSC